MKRKIVRYHFVYKYFLYFAHNFIHIFHQFFIDLLIMFIIIMNSFVEQCKMRAGNKVNVERDTNSALFLIIEQKFNRFVALLLLYHYPHLLLPLVLVYCHLYLLLFDFFIRSQYFSCLWFLTLDVLLSTVLCLHFAICICICTADKRLPTLTQQIG